MNDEKTLYWKLSIPAYGQAGYIATLPDVMAELGASGGEDSYLLEPVRMTQAEIDALPEFEGF